MSEGAGAMRARITLQWPARVADEIGGAATLWTSAGDVWAEIAASSVSDSADYDTARSTVGYTLSIYRRADVRAGWRVLWGGRRLRIAAVRDDGAPRIVLVCEEEKL
ncbi:MAG: phage head closure protein [Terricaulis sp.]